MTWPGGTYLGVPPPPYLAWVTYLEVLPTRVGTPHLNLAKVGTPHQGRYPPLSGPGKGRYPPLRLDLAKVSTPGV